MTTNRETGLVPGRTFRDPFTLLRQLTSEFDRIFEDPFKGFRWPVKAQRFTDPTGWYPEIDVFEKDTHLYIKVDLPGMTRDDVKVDVIEGELVISGERKTEVEETHGNVYRCERAYGRFSRAVTLPAGVKYEDVNATFVDGVLEIRVALPVAVEPKAYRVDIDAAEPAKAA